MLGSGNSHIKKCLVKQHRNAEPGSAVDSQERAILQLFFRSIFLQI